jgi:hypothetical protein
MSISSILRKLSLGPRVTNEYKYVYASMSKDYCTYCSSPATSWDHVLPISIARLLPYFEFSSELLQLVPCCTRCNSIAGNRFFTCLSAKKKYIIARLSELRARARYAKVLDELEVYLRK